MSQALLDLLNECDANAVAKAGTSPELQGYLFGVWMGCKAYLFALNKMDCVDRAKLLDAMRQMFEAHKTLAAAYKPRKK